MLSWRKLALGFFNIRRGFAASEIVIRSASKDFCATENHSLHPSFGVHHLLHTAYPKVPGQCVPTIRPKSEQFILDKLTKMFTICHSPGLAQSLVKFTS